MEAGSQRFLRYDCVREFHYLFNLKSLSMKKIRKLKGWQRLLSALTLFFVCTLAAMGQSVQVKGVVIEKSTGEPVVGATVVQKGTTNATVTDIDGKFALKAPVNSTLEIRFVGYVSYNLKVKNEGPYTVSLQDDNELLDESLPYNA